MYLCQAEGLPGVVRQRPKLVQEEGTDRYRCHRAGRIPQVLLYNCVHLTSRLAFDHRTKLKCALLRYDAINKMIGMLAEEITVNKGRAAYAGKVILVLGLSYGWQTM